MNRLRVGRNIAVNEGLGIQITMMIDIVIVIGSGERTTTDGVEVGVGAEIEIIAEVNDDTPCE